MPTEPSAEGRPPLGPRPAAALAALADLGLSEAEMARYFGASPERIARLRDRMADGWAAVDGAEPVSHAARRMAEHGLRALPVIAAGRRVGLLTEADIVRKVVAAGRDPARTRADAAMTPLAPE